MGKKIGFIPIVLMLILMSGCTTENAESIVCVGSEQVATEEVTKSEIIIESEVTPPGSPMEEVTKSEIIIEGVDGEENHYVYDRILSEIVTALQSDPHTVENNEYFTMGICEVAILGETAEDRVKSISYAFYDINTDGINELIITKNPDAMYPDMRILDIYTIEDGSAVNLVSGYVRNRYYLLDDNTLLNSGSGGAAYSFNELLVFQAGTNKLVSQGLFFSYPKDEDMRECGYYYSEDGIYDVEVATEITAEEYGVFYDELQSRMVMLELTLIEC